AWRRPLDAADRADADEQRKWLRALVARAPNAEEAGRLSELAKPETAAGLPPATLELPRLVLAGQGRAAEAEAALRAGLRRQPADAWLNHGLGALLLAKAPPRAAEAVRYLLVARALRPELAVSLAAAWLAGNDPAEAAAVLDELV